TTGALAPEADGSKPETCACHAVSLGPPAPNWASRSVAAVAHISPMTAFARLAASARYRASFVARMDPARIPIRPRTPNEKIRIATSASSKATPCCAVRPREQGEAKAKEDALASGAKPRPEGRVRTRGRRPTGENRGNSESLAEAAR